MKADGSRLDRLRMEFRDNPDVVKVALKNGAFIEQASLRLQNDPELSVFNARYGRRKKASDYDRALFCLKQDVSLFKTYCSPFSRCKEFNLDAKLLLGGAFVSPFSDVNSSNEEQIAVALCQEREKTVLSFKEKYWSYTSRITRFSFGDAVDTDLRIKGFLSPYAMRICGMPLSAIVDELEQKASHYEEEKEAYCSINKMGSFSERYMDALLTSLRVEFTREAVFSWSKGKDGKTGEKRYDFFLPNQMAIIEMNGAQHYEKGFEGIGGRTLEEEQKNDELKKNLALANGIRHYIVIDARKSKETFLQESISKSEEFAALFDTRRVDWKNIRSGMIKERNIFPTPIQDAKISRTLLYARAFKNALTNEDVQVPPCLAQQDG